MRQAYLDCSSGISGDMFLAAILDAGLAPKRLLDELKKVPLGYYEFKRTRAVRGGIVGTRIEISAPSDQPERKLQEIESLLRASTLTETVKSQAGKIFTRLAEVEGKLHNKSPYEVHFHEVGAVDAIVDVVGACAGIELLEVSELVCSPLNVGGGRAKAEHGSLPVPAPATAELLAGIPVYSTGVEAELVTPTGAVLVASLSASFGPFPPMRIERVGYGAGGKEIPGQPNVVRLFLGERAEIVKAEPGKPGDELVSVIEANVDDMSPQLYGYLVEQALAGGALDVTCGSVHMKKNRPGLLVTILCPPEKCDDLSQLLFEQTTTIGVRIHEARRHVLEREVVSVETEYGEVRVKVAKKDGKVLNVAPEYEDCQRLAGAKSVPLKQVILAAQLAYMQKES